MGIYIKGMEMPSGCTDCSFSYQSMYCKAMPSHFCGSPEWEIDGVKPEWCPLTEVKEPHGDLVDSKYIIDQLNKVDYDTYYVYACAFDIIDKAPTVIERSEDDEE